MALAFAGIVPYLPPMRVFRLLALVAILGSSAIVFAPAAGANSVGELRYLTAWPTPSQGCTVMWGEPIQPTPTVTGYQVDSGPHGGAPTATVVVPSSTKMLAVNFGADYFYADFTVTPLYASGPGIARTKSCITSPPAWALASAPRSVEAWRDTSGNVWVSWLPPLDLHGGVGAFWHIWQQVGIGGGIGNAVTCSSLPLGSDTRLQASLGNGGIRKVAVALGTGACPNGQQDAIPGVLSDIVSLP